MQGFAHTEAKPEVHVCGGPEQVGTEGGAGEPSRGEQWEVN